MSQNKKRCPSRGKRDTREGELLEKKLEQEEPDSGQTMGTARGET